MTATTSFAILLLVLLPLVPRALRTLCWYAAVASVLGVGFTRIALGVHWFSDVVGGWLLGLAVVALTTWAFEVWRTDAGRGHAGLGEDWSPNSPEPTPNRAPPAGNVATGPYATDGRVRDIPEPGCSEGEFDRGRGRGAGGHRGASSAREPAHCGSVSVVPREAPRVRSHTGAASSNNWCSSVPRW